MSSSLYSVYNAPVRTMSNVPNASQPYTGVISKNAETIQFDGSQKFYINPMTILGNENTFSLTISFVATNGGTSATADITMSGAEIDNMGVKKSHLFQLAVRPDTNSGNRIIVEFHPVGSEYDNDAVLNFKQSDVFAPPDPANCQIYIYANTSSSSFLFIPEFAGCVNGNTELLAYWFHNPLVGSNYGECCSPYLLSYIGSQHTYGFWGFDTVNLVEENHTTPYLAGTGSISQRLNDKAVTVSCGSIFRTNNPNVAVNGTSASVTRGALTSSLYANYVMETTIMTAEHMWLITDAYDADSTKPNSTSISSISINSGTVLIIPHYNDFDFVVESYANSEETYVVLNSLVYLEDAPSVGTVYIQDIVNEEGGARNDPHVQTITYNASKFETIITSSLHGTMLGFALNKAGRVPSVKTLPVVFGGYMAGNGGKFTEFLSTYIQSTYTYSDMPSYTADVDIAVDTTTWISRVTGHGFPTTISAASAQNFANDAANFLPLEMMYGPVRHVPFVPLVPTQFGITLWCEAPLVGGAVTQEEYWSRLVSFVANKPVERVIIRLEDAASSDNYYITTDTSSYTDPNSTYGRLVNSFLLDPTIMSSGIDIWVLPVMIQQAWISPLDGSFTPTTNPDFTSLYTAQILNSQQVVVWVQQANELIENVAAGGNATYINGICFEDESNHPGTTAELVCQGFQTGFGTYLTSPTPAWLANPFSTFFLAYSKAPPVNYNSDAVFDQGFTGVFIHKLVPQYYNLTRTVITDTRVDAYELGASITNPSPVYPSTIYTLSTDSTNGSTGNSSKLVLEFYRDWLDYMPVIPFQEFRKSDVIPMFSCEVSNVAYPTNSFNRGGTTITGIEGTGLINAFGAQATDGSPLWSWDQFYRFAKEFAAIFSNVNGDEQSAQSIGLFQFNLIPNSWS